MGFAGRGWTAKQRVGSKCTPRNSLICTLCTVAHINELPCQLQQKEMKRTNKMRVNMGIIMQEQRKVKGGRMVAIKK